MTTEPAWSRHAAAAALVLATWFTALALAPLALNPSAVLVLGPRNASIRATEAAGGSVTSLGAGAIEARSASPGFVGALYANGAWLVLPGPGLGCFGRPDPMGPVR